MSMKQGEGSINSDYFEDLRRACVEYHDYIHSSDYDPTQAREKRYRIFEQAMRLFSESENFD